MPLYGVVAAAGGQVAGANALAELQAQVTAPSVSIVGVKVTVGAVPPPN